MAQIEKEQGKDMLLIAAVEFVFASPTNLSRAISISRKNAMSCRS